MELNESYRLLGLKAGATLEEARRAYHERVKFFHPDRHQGSPGLLRRATEETKKLNVAYECVCKVLGLARKSASERGGSEKRPRRHVAGDPPVSAQAFIVPSCGVKLTWVNGGSFRMGSPAGEGGRSMDEGPETEVTISQGFWLGTFPVTQEEWEMIAEAVHGIATRPSYFRGEHLPVEQVSWIACQSWVQELSAVEQAGNRLPAGFSYRLPTEAEWEFACRAGTCTAFHSGEDAEMLAEYGWYLGNSRSRSHPVGEKKANAWGLHDMHGNVWEWCGDWYGGPLPGGSVTDPRGPARGINRVFRGGSWGVAASRCRSAYRVWNKPGYRDYTLGFRVALARCSLVSAHE